MKVLQLEQLLARGEVVGDDVGVELDPNAVRSGGGRGIRHGPDEDTAASDENPATILLTSNTPANHNR